MSRLGFIPPQLPSLTDQPPEGGDWIHEVKHDGYRTMLVVERGTARAYTRNGHDWSDRYPGIIAAARKLPCRSAILDGEVIVQDARGVSDFEALQAAFRSKTTHLIFYAFAGDMPDPTAGATHFLNPTVVRQRSGGSLPSWARGEGVSIGRHTFYSPDEAHAVRHWAGLSLDGIWSAIFHPGPHTSF